MGHAVDIADGDEFHEEAYVCVDDYGVEGASARGVGFGQLAVVVDVAPTPKPPTKPRHRPSEVSLLCERFFIKATGYHDNLLRTQVLSLDGDG